MSRDVRGDAILCKQCEMPLEGNVECQQLRTVDDNQETGYNIHMLYAINGDDIESDVGELDQVPTYTESHEPPVNRRKKKRGRTANRPPQVSAQARPEIHLTEETL